MSTPGRLVAVTPDPRFEAAPASESTSPTPSGHTPLPRWARRGVPWAGALFIATIVATAAWDIVRSHDAAAAETGRDLETQARMIAEQTARSVQAADVVLRHMAQQYRQGELAHMDERRLHEYMREQAVGLVQIDGLFLTGADGQLRATSWRDPVPPNVPNIADHPAFRAARDDPTLGLVFADAIRSTIDGQWVFPFGRRLQGASGAFAGVVAARGRVDYFQRFYRDLALDTGTTTTLLHRDGTLIARHPARPDALGRHFAGLDHVLAERDRGHTGAFRARSPIDGVDRFAAVRNVPDYPLEVVVTREAALALAPWRSQALGTALRTLALAVLAAMLMSLLMRQLARVHRVRESLELQKNRFALAVAGSDDGIWDWDQSSGMVFASARTRELLSLPPGPETVPMAEWFAALRLHPDDVPRRQKAMDDHLAGLTPHYEGEYRVCLDDGNYRWVRIRGLCVRDADGHPQRMAGSISDIDARKRAEEALRESEERYRIAMTGSNEGHWVWNVDDDRIFASPSLYRLFGLPQDAQLTTRGEFFQRVPMHGEDRAVLERAVAEHAAGRTPHMEVDYRVILPDGSLRWIHSRGQCFRDAEGRPLRFAGATIDITERKRAEEALRESEQRFALAVAGANDGIIDWNIAADTVFASDRALGLLGMCGEPAPASGSAWVARAATRFHPEDARKLREAVRDGKTEPASDHRGEYRVRAEGGGWRWVRFRGRTVRDGRGRAVRWAGSVSDIDALKKAEEALRQSEERYQLAVLGSREGLWDWDLASDTMFLSPRAQQLLWQDAGEPLRPRREWISRTEYHPEDVGRVRAALVAHLHGESEHFEVQYRVRHHDGSWRWFRQRGVAVRDADGRPYRMAGSMEDITRLKNSEAQRERLEQQLRQSQKLEAMGTLAGGIAHDFNNILAAILGYGEMALKDAPQGSTQRRHLDSALSAGMRARSLVERILAFSRSGMGERMPVHVATVVNEALDAAKGSLPAGVRMRRAIGGGDTAVLGDPTQIHQVVMNLCANAAQAMSQSGGALGIELSAVDAAQPLRLTTGELPPGRYLRLEVSDTGVGIAPNVMERIFDPFFTTKEVGVGTGLGLSLVHGIVTDLGGGIEVQSRLGEGTLLAVYLPSCGEAAPPNAPEEALTPGHGETVLLVDDEHALVQLGEEMLAELGYEPVGFESSTAALRSFQEEPDRYDMVLSDESMPELTGSELAREIRRLRPDIPIVLMTGYVTPALSARAKAVGVDQLLSKPLVAREIARSLAAALRR